MFGIGSADSAISKITYSDVYTTSNTEDYNYCENVLKRNIK